MFILQVGSFRERHLRFIGKDRQTGHYSQMGRCRQTGRGRQTGQCRQTGQGCQTGQEPGNQKLSNLSNFQYFPHMFWQISQSLKKITGEKKIRFEMILLSFVKQGRVLFAVQ